METSTSGSDHATAFGPTSVAAGVRSDPSSSWARQVGSGALSSCSSQYQPTGPPGPSRPGTAATPAATAPA